MPSIYDLKPRFQSLMRPWVRLLADQGVTANHLTVAAMILSLVWGALMAFFAHERWPLLMMPIIVFLRIALNAADGMLAREHGMKSPQGVILNELGDVLSDTALYLPFALLAGVNPVWVVLVTILAVMSEMTGVIAVHIGTERRYDGPMGKSDRAFVFGALGLLLGMGIDPGNWVDAALAIVVVLLVVTIVNRARGALREVS